MILGTLVFIFLNFTAFRVYVETVNAYYYGCRGLITVGILLLTAMGYFFCLYLILHSAVGSNT